MKIPGLEVISVHVPKTAGSSLRVALNEIFGRSELITDYSRQLQLIDPDGCGVLLKLSRLRTVPRRIVRHVHARIGGRCVHGHFAASWYAQDNPDALRAGWVRHPGHRMVSHYYHWRRHGRRAHSLGYRVRNGEIDLEEFLVMHNLKDLQHRYLDIPTRQMDFLGLQERFSEDLRSMVDRLGADPDLVGIPEENVGATNSERTWNDLPGEVRRRFEAIHGRDMELYLRLRDNGSGWQERR